MTEHDYDISELASATVYRILSSDMRKWPYPHMVLDEFLDRGMFSDLMAADLTPLLRRRNSSDTGSEAKRFNFDLFAPPPEVALPSAFAGLRDVLQHPTLGRMLLKVFGPLISGRFAGEIPPVVLGAEVIEDRTNYELPPHTDIAIKLITVLFYLADEDADPQLGTEIYAPRSEFHKPDPNVPRHQRSSFVRVATVPYRPNTALIFAPGTNTFHGVGPVEGPEVTRRLVQFQINLDIDAYQRQQAANEGPVGF
jgi:hypothetical protein